MRKFFTCALLNIIMELVKMRFNIKKNGIHQNRISVATCHVTVAEVDVCDCLNVATEYTFVTHRNQLAVNMRIPKGVFTAEKLAREAVNAHRMRTNKVRIHNRLDIQAELEWLRPVFVTWLSESYHKYDEVVVEVVEGKDIIHRVNIDGVHEFLVPVGYLEVPQDLYHWLWSLDTGAL